MEVHQGVFTWGVGQACDGCGVVAPVQPFSKASSRNAVASTSDLLFCSSCRSFGSSHVRSLRELRKALHKSKKGFLLEPSLVHGGFEQELSLYRKQNLRSLFLSTPIDRPCTSSGWNRIVHQDESSVAPSDLNALGEFDEVSKIDDEELTATHELELNSVERLEQELHPPKSFELEFKSSLVKRVEQESQDVSAVMFVASLGIREVVSKWSPGFAAWCTSCGKKPKLGRVEANFTEPPSLLVGTVPVSSIAAAIFPTCNSVSCKDPEAQRTESSGHKKPAPSGQQGHHCGRLSLIS